jgi:hypothetical protein
MKRGSAVMLLEIAIAAAIVLWLAQFMLKQYFKPAASDPQTRQLMESQGIGGSTSPQSTIDATRRALDRAQEIESQRLKDLEQAN